jgi:hypothetical protein
MHAVDHATKNPDLDAASPPKNLRNLSLPPTPFGKPLLTPSTAPQPLSATIHTHELDIPNADIFANSAMFTRLGQLEAWVQADARMLEKQLHKVRELEEQIAILEAKTEELRVLRRCVLSICG